MLQGSREIKGYLLTITAGILLSIKITIQKKICPDLNPDILTFYVSVGGIISSLIVMAIMEKPKWPNNQFDVILVFVHMAATGLAMATCFHSLTMISQISYSLVTSCYIIFSLIGQYTVLYNINPGNENAEEYAGVALIFLCIFVAYLSHFTFQCKKGNEEEQQSLIPLK